MQGDEEVKEYGEEQFKISPPTPSSLSPPLPWPYPIPFAPLRCYLCSMQVGNGNSRTTLFTRSEFVAIDQWVLLQKGMNALP